VKPSSRDKLIAEVERVFVFAGATDYDSAALIFGKLLQWVQERYCPMRSKRDLSALLDAMPEPSWMEKRFLFGAFRYMPQLVRYWLKRVGNHVEDDFPEIPRGRPGLDAFTKEQIIAHVGKRHIAGYTLDQAKKRAAKKFEVSEAAVQRAWDDRGNRNAVDFRSVLKYLASGGENDVLEAACDEPADRAANP
jgi:hypothetical protein